MTVTQVYKNCLLTRAHVRDLFSMYSPVKYCIFQCMKGHFVSLKWL